MTQAQPQRLFSPNAVDYGVILILLAIALSQLVIWPFWNPAMGDSVKNLITYSQGILAALCLIVWWFLRAPVSQSTRLGFGLPVVALILGWVASIRSVEFSGDMRITLHYRWQQSAAEKLAAHRAGQGALSLEELESLPVPEAQPEDMPEYRGRRRDGYVIGPPLLQDWETNPPQELWRHPCGGGYASMAIVEPFLVTLEQRGEEEAVVCYDTRDGRELWEHRYPAYFSEAMGGVGPRSTPTIHEDAVYSFGAFSDLCCLDLRTGRLRWHVNPLAQFGLGNTDWAMSSSPLVHAGNVIVNIGGQKGDGLAAYSLNEAVLSWHSGGLPNPNLSQGGGATGQAALLAGGAKTVPGYSSPMLATLHGQLQILNFDGTALRGHSVDDGQQLWAFPYKTEPHVSVAQPVVFDDGRVFISVSYGEGAAMVQVTRDGALWSADERPIWKNLNMRCKFTSPVLVDGYLYGLDEGILVCVDPADGQRKWKGGRTGLRGRYGHGQLLVTNGQIVAQTEQGEAVLIDPSPEELREVTRLRVLPEGKNWNPFALVRGRIYVRNASEMAAFDLTAARDSGSGASEE